MAPLGLETDTGTHNGRNSVWDVPYRCTLVSAVSLLVPLCFSSVFAALPFSAVLWSHYDVLCFLLLSSSAARVGLMHIGVFILLLLSGERNFGVRLNKPYSVRVPMDIPVFTGTHADLLIIVSTAPAVLFLSLLTPG